MLGLIVLEMVSVLPILLQKEYVVDAVLFSVLASQQPYRQQLPTLAALHRVSLALATKVSSIQAQYLGCV